MSLTIADLQKEQKAVIVSFDTTVVPLKLIEMGCMEGNSVELLQVAPFGDPLYLAVNDTYLAIRKETARGIFVEIIE